MFPCSVSHSSSQATTPRNFKLKCSKKTLSYFHYDEEAEFNFLKISHNGRAFAGFTLKTDLAESERKIKRYGSGLAFQIPNHFPDSERRVLATSECLEIVGLCRAAVERERTEESFPCCLLV